MEFQQHIKESYNFYIKAFFYARFLKFQSINITSTNVLAAMLNFRSLSPKDSSFVIYLIMESNLTFGSRGFREEMESHFTFGSRGFREENI